MKVEVKDNAYLDQGYKELVGIVLDYAEDGICTGHLDVRSELLNPMKIVHGGAIYSLADTVASTAAFTSGFMTVTVTGNMDFIRPAIAKRLVCHAKTVKAGNSLIRVSCSVFNEKEEELGKGYFMFFKTSEAVKS